MAISSKKSEWLLKKNERRGAKSSTAQPAGERRLHVGHPVGDREGQLLDGRRPRLADVVAADRDGVPAGQLAGAELDRVGHQAHRGRRREEELLLGDVLLEDVVLDRALEGGPRDALLLGGHDVHRPDRGGRGVDRHRGADPVEREPGEEGLHVGQRADRDAAGAELALGLRVVGVVAVEGRHVVGDREPGLPRVEQGPEAGVRVLGGAEAGEHPHRPEPAAVAGGVDAAGEGRGAGLADAAAPRSPVAPGRRSPPPAPGVIRAVDAADLDVGDRGEAVATLAGTSRAGLPCAGC